MGKVLAGMVLTLAGYGVLTTGAMGPAYGNVQPLPEPVVQAASLSYADGQVMLTGSVEHMFDGAAFTGPNRAEKRDRARINVDPLAFTNAFEKARIRLAALRNPADDPALPGQSRLADAGETATAPEEGPRMSVAAIDPAAGAAALSAISAIDQTVPMPLIASDQLAYARANEPATDFSKPTAQYSEKELWCLATAIYFEARGEIYRGQVAVAQVVMNRLKHKLYPKTICGVVFQNQNKRNACQFSFACDGRPETITDEKAWAQAEEIAGKVASGELYLSEVSNATHYHASYVYPDWAPRMKKVTKIGLHVFYRFRTGWRFG